MIYKSRNWIYQLETLPEKTKTKSTKVEIGYINQSRTIDCVPRIYKSRNWIYQLEFMLFPSPLLSTKVEIGYINQRRQTSIRRTHLQKQKLDISIREHQNYKVHNNLQKQKLDISIRVHRLPTKPESTKVEIGYINQS